MAFGDRTISLELRLRQQLSKITDRQVRDLVRAWATAWDEVAPDLEAALLDALAAGENVTASQLLRSHRLTRALDSIARQLRLVADQAGVRITSDLQKVIDDAGSLQSRLIASQLPMPQKVVDLDAWSKVSDHAIALIVKRSTEQIHQSTYTLSRTADLAVRRELIRGVAAGSNPKAVARRMVDRAHGAFNGGLSRAMTLARTEMLDAHREAARLGQEQHTDVLAGWMWVASLTPRTCPACWGKHGSIHELDEPGPNGHQCCRCARVPITKPWSALGFKDIPEPPPLVQDADQLFDQLSPIQQHQILGTKGYIAWKAGKFPRSKWAVRQQNPGWRDSFVPARPPKVSSASLPPANRPKIRNLPPVVKPGADPLKDVPKIDPQLIANMEKRGVDVPEWNRRATNPLNGTDPAYGINCQRCVMTYEARSRGYDVTAKPNRDGAGNPDVFLPWTDGALDRFKASGRYWVTPDTLRIVKAQDPDLAKQMVTDPVKYVEGVAKRWPVGGRGWVAFFRPRGGGHIFNIDRTAEGVVVREAQVPGAEGRTLDYYLSQASKLQRRNGVLKLDRQSVFVLRVDDLQFNDGVLEAITWQ